MKQILSLILLLCCTLAGKVSTGIVLESDSLIKVSETLLYDTTRLNVLNQIIGIEQNNQQYIQYSDALMKKALQLGNDKYAALAAYYHILYYYNRNNQDNVAKRLTIVELHARRSNLWNYFFDAKRFQIDLYTFSEQCELAINESQKMQQQASQVNSDRGSMAAHQCLSNAHIGSQRWGKGVEALEAAYQLFIPAESPMVHTSVLSQLVPVIKERKDNKKLLKYLQELENTLHNHTSANPSSKAGLADIYLFNELFYSYYRLNTHQPQQAYEHLVKSKEYLDENTYFMYRVLYFDTFARYYQATEAYQQASDYIDMILTTLKKDFTSDYAEQLFEKVRIWKQVR